MESARRAGTAGLILAAIALLVVGGTSCARRPSPRDNPKAGAGVRVRRPLPTSSASRPAGGLLYALGDRERIRGIYIHPGQAAQLGPFRSAGFNTVLAKWDISVPIKPREEQIVEPVISKTHKNGMAFVFVLNFWGADSVFFPTYRPFVGKDGRPLPKAPCPTDPAIWREFIAPRVSAAARMGAEAVILDMELYQTEPNVDYPGPCFCDDCLRAFAAARGLSPANVAAFRQTVAAQLLEPFYAYQRDVIAAEARRIRRQIPPSVALGTFQADRSPFMRAEVPAYDGPAIGLGTDLCPTLSFSESLYSGKSTYESWPDHVRTAKAYFDKLGAHVVSVYGLTFTALAPDPLAEKARDYAMNTEGYWVFTSEVFAPDCPPEARARGELSDYLDELKAANDEVKAWLTEP